jgi:uncharacterized membrane protein
MSAPTFWRTELWHPVTIHFPIALLLLATIVKIVALVTKGKNQEFWQKVGDFLLYVGVAGAWLAVYTGDLAEAVVARKICDPLLLKSHESASFNVAWLFTGAAVLQLAVSLHFLQFSQYLLKLLILFIMLVGSGYLVYSSHLGAQVVYEQAGGVNVPASDCLGL